MRKLDPSNAWQHTALGEYLQAQEQALFDDAVSDVFGFNAVQLGMLHMDLLRQARIPYAVRADSTAGTVRCESVQLPFTSNSIDLLLMPHTLDFSQNPQQTLREAERVLVAEGHIIISGFNPISAWGMKRYLKRKDGFPWNSNFLSLLRIKDWLALLGLEVVSGRMACYAPPLSSYQGLQRCRWMDKLGRRCWPMMGGVYFVVAKKRVLGMRLIRPSRHAAKFKPRLVAVPSQKGHKNKLITRQINLESSKKYE